MRTGRLAVFSYRLIKLPAGRSELPATGHQEPKKSSTAESLAPVHRPHPSARAPLAGILRYPSQANGKLDRQAVDARSTGVGGSPEARGRCLSVNQRPHRWQHSCHPVGESGTTVAGMVVGNESVLGNWSRSDGPLSNMPLQLTRAVQLSVDGQRAGAARHFKRTGGRRAAPAVLLSTIT